MVRKISVHDNDKVSSAEVESMNVGRPWDKGYQFLNIKKHKSIATQDQVFQNEASAPGAVTA